MAIRAAVWMCDRLAMRAAWRLGPRLDGCHRRVYAVGEWMPRASVGRWQVDAIGEWMPLAGVFQVRRTSSKTASMVRPFCLRPAKSWILAGV